MQLIVPASLPSEDHTLTPARCFPGHWPQSPRPAATSFRRAEDGVSFSDPLAHVTPGTPEGSCACAPAPPRMRRRKGAGLRSINYLCAPPAGGGREVASAEKIIIRKRAFPFFVCLIYRCLSPFQGGREACRRARAPQRARKWWRGVLHDKKKWASSTQTGGRHCVTL